MTVGRGGALESDGFLLLLCRTQMVAGRDKDCSVGNVPVVQA